MDDLLREFLTETNESMETLGVELVKFEQNPNDPTLLGNIFRLMHTVKGTCGFLGLPRLESVAHAGENILGKIRDGALTVTPQAISLVLEALDRIKTLLVELEAKEAEPAGEDADLIARLNAYAAGETAPVSAAPPAAEAPAAAGGPAVAEGGFPVAAELLAEVAAAQPAAKPAAQAAAAPARATLFDRVGGEAAIVAAVDGLYARIMADENLRRFFDNVDLARLKSRQAAFMAAALGGPAAYDGADLKTVHARLVADGLDDRHFDAVAAHLQATLTELKVAPDLIGEIVAAVAATREDVLGGATTAAAAAPEPPVAAASPAAPTPAKPAASDKEHKDPVEQKESAIAAQSIRVGVGVLENLMTMVSELVLTRNQLLQLQRGRVSSEEFMAPLQRLNHITSELQEGVMKTRMQPIGNAWSKLPRLVRDLSHEVGKKIDLQMHGTETELDRQVLELIRDPLTHMVRNSADHGIERPAERQAAGKSPVGTVTLNAFHEGGHIIIEVKDDGRGLDAERIREKALKTGVASASDLAEMSEQQLFQFIFRAGFSTAAKVTNVSGRGVGMDVVRTNIEKIGGTIELHSAKDKGTSFTIKIPLTLAIVSALVVECGKERFAIPQINVLELVRAQPGSETRIERVNDAAVLRLRDRLLPLVPLRKLLKIELAEEAAVPEDRTIVVTQVGAQTFGIIVDRVFDTEEIVVKPVAPLLRDIQLFAGNTILGDGSVIMILDPNGIAGAASHDLAIVDRASNATAAATAQQDDDRVAMLVFKAGNGTPKAVPLGLVARIEEIAVGSIESSSAGRMIVQYRGKLMPLVLTEGGAVKTEGRQPVLVFSDAERAMGLVVDEVVDIVETKLDVEMRADRPGYLGSAIINGKATDTIDTAHYLTLAYRDWFERQRAGEDKAVARRRVLVVDDSSFFRNMLTPMLSSAGFEVTASASAQEALDLCESGRDFDVIVSDLEMPGMSGFDFAQTVRAGGRWQRVPLLALSSHANPEDIARGRSAGFVGHLAKFDRDALLHGLTSALEGLRGAA